MIDKIKQIESSKKINFVKHSSLSLISNDVRHDISRDINNAFSFNDKKFAIANKEGVRKYPIFTKKNLAINIKYYGKFPELKNRMKLTKEKKSFNMRELNAMVSILREEFIINTYITLMDAARMFLLDELFAKMKLIATMTKNLKSLSSVFGRFWDLSYHDLYQMDLTFIKKMQELMQNRPFVTKIAELLGRAALAFKKYEEYLVKEMTYIYSNKNYYYAPENIIGVSQGNAIPDLLPLSLAYKKFKLTKKIFNLQYIEKKLMQFDKRIKMLDEVEITRIERRLKQESKGPFILVIDTSGSMHGEPELMAKTFALAFINIANKEQRKCYIINFSHGIIEFDASDLGKSWTQLYHFLAMSFGGGTDINPAVAAAIKKLEDSNYQNADVIFVSDLIINALEPNLEQRISQLKQKKVRWHSLTIGHAFHPLNATFLDNNWLYDGSQQSVKNILKDLEKYNLNK